MIDAVLKSDADFFIIQNDFLLESFCVPGNWNEDIVQKSLTFHIFVNMRPVLYLSFRLLCGGEAVEKPSKIRSL